MSEYTITDSFSKIKSEAGADLTFIQSSPGQMILKSSKEVKCSISDESELLIQGRPGANINFGYNNIITSGNMIMTSGNGSNISISGNNINYSGGGQIYVNGRLIDLDNLPNQNSNTETQKDTSYSTEWSFTGYRPISRVSLSGSGTTLFRNQRDPRDLSWGEQGERQLASNFIVMISGSAQFHLPSNNYDSVRAKVSG